MGAGRHGHQRGGQGGGDWRGKIRHVGRDGLLDHGCCGDSHGHAYLLERGGSAGTEGGGEVDGGNLVVTAEEVGLVQIS